MMHSDLTNDVIIVSNIILHTGYAAYSFIRIGETYLRDMPMKIFPLRSKIYSFLHDIDYSLNS